MKTLYLGGVTPNADLSKIFNKDRLFVIGVKNGGDINLDYFLKVNPRIQLHTRFKEVDNARYLDESSYGKHILQPAILTWKD